MTPADYEALAKRLEDVASASAVLAPLCLESAAALRKMADAAKRLEAALQVAERKLRYAASVFNNPNFTDRYGDGASFAAAADQARNELASMPKEPT
jgi:hypothetical protein